MFTGLLGAAMLVGLMAAGASFSISGSFMLALVVYSMTGTCVMLAAMLVVALRGDAGQDHIESSEPERLREAA